MSLTGALATGPAGPVDTWTEPEPRGSETGFLGPLLRPSFLDRLALLLLVVRLRDFARHVFLPGDRYSRPNVGRSTLMLERSLAQSRGISHRRGRESFVLDPGLLVGHD